MQTMGSMYDADCVNVFVRDTEENGTYEIYRMPCSTIIQMVNEFVFKVEKKRKYKYLIEAVYDPIPE